MRTLFLLAASSALALTTAACAPAKPEARAKLDCPASQGDLTRTSISPDGKACNYTTAEGDEVTLQLVSTAGGVDQALSAIEANLLAGRIQPPADAKDTKDSKDKDAKVDDRAAAGDAKPEAARSAEEAAKEAAADAKSASITVEMKDGKVVTTEGDDDNGNVRVNLPGIHVEANENDETAKVSVGPIHIDAGGDGATIRMRRDVRLRGEALSPNRRGIRATFIYSREDLPNGYKLVGYEAGGPKTGPITVAIVKSKSDRHSSDELYPDVKRLVRKNGGV